MKGNTLPEFIDDLLTMGCPGKEFIFRGKRYFMESQPYSSNPLFTELVIFECSNEGHCTFRRHGKNNAECVEQFEAAPIFDGLTIYEAEQEIEVIFG